MRFVSPKGETVFVAEISPESSFMFNEDLRTGLSIVWNTGREAMFMIDQEELSLARNCMLFLTEYHHVDQFKFDTMNVVQFNRPFYCVEEDDQEVGCKGALFFGALRIPKVQIPLDGVKPFTILWEAMMMEIDESDPFKLEMLRALLRRWLILSLRLHRKQSMSLSHDTPGLPLIREFNYLVEKHYKELSRVSDYADLLHKSPKTISNTFRKFVNRSPLQVINDRRLLEARRQLTYTNQSIKQIAHEVNFRDVQSFSHFFQQHTGRSPSAYREEMRDLSIG